jgi:hypothetical protein
VTIFTKLRFLPHTWRHNPKIQYAGRCKGENPIVWQEAPMGSNRARRRREFWKRETIVIGNLLLDAITLERDLAAQSLHKPTQDLVRHRQFCRTVLKRLIGDYAHAVARYRIAMKAPYRSRIRG